METNKTLGLVAHDHMKRELIDWVVSNWQSIYKHKLICTGTTGKLIEEALSQILQKNGIDADQLSLQKLKSGPLGGDQQLGAYIAEGKIDLLVFFWDPMLPQPHEVDVKALLRITVVYNVPTACNRGTADFLVTSGFFNNPYQAKVIDYNNYIHRKI